ncbi:hypothetical protein NUSPORA_01797 [Nucleospora cyclopteri]
MSKENLIQIPKITNKKSNKNTKKSNKTLNTMLEKAIMSRDETFITDFIENGDLSEINLLSESYKIECAKFMVDLIYSSSKNAAIKTLKQIVTDVGDVEGICKSLAKYSTDFNKLVYLKGKIEYLKYRKRKMENLKPENKFSI